MSVTCCGQKAQWTVISHNLRYWYCKECKNEVREETADQLRARLSNTPTDIVSFPALSQQEIDDLFNDINRFDGADLTYYNDPLFDLKSSLISNLARYARQDLEIQIMNICNSNFESPSK